MSIHYISEKTMKEIGMLEDDALSSIWELLLDGLIAVAKGNAVLPLDAYLRSQKPEEFNRIIAKLGVVENISGVKWIASAPLNTQKGIPRASGLLILNDLVTGQVYSILDAIPISNIRTAGISLLFLQKFRSNFKRAVIVGAGVHAREHMRQLEASKRMGYFPHLENICIYDVVEGVAAQMASELDQEVEVLDHLDEVAADDTAILYCTNALTPYVDEAQVIGYSGLTAVNMSLRDYTGKALVAFDRIVTDVTENVAQAKTSVDLAVTAGLLDKNDCVELPHLLLDKASGKANPFKDEENVIFNPMGLVSHDLKLGRHVFERSAASNNFIELPV